MSQPELLSLFPTPVYTYKLKGEEYEIVQKELQRTVDGLYENNIWGQHPEWDKTEHFLSNSGNFSENILNENLENVKNSILNHCNNYLNMLQVKSGYRVVVETSWLTLTKPGLHDHIHDHGTNIVSGVYWFKTNGSDGI
jgi:hypothetical protein